jgi:predicted GNAT family N-acyltransferase
MNSPDFSLRRASWQQDSAALSKVRKIVFLQEQKVPEELEWDGEDKAAIHVLAIDAKGQPIGTGRLLPGGQIGRMAVLPSRRNQGIGGAILEQLQRIADTSGISPLFLNAQTGAINFYKRHGFHTVGAEFMEAGIPHCRMEISDRLRHHPVS